MTAQYIVTKPDPRPENGGLLAAFRGLGKGVDEKAAYEQSKNWFRSGGAPWTRSLS